MYVYNVYSSPIAFSWSFNKHSDALSTESPKKFEIPSNSKKFVELWLTSKKLLNADERKNVLSAAATIVSTQKPIQINGESQLKLNIYSAVSDPFLNKRQGGLTLTEGETSPTAFKTTSQPQTMSLVISQQGRNKMSFVTAVYLNDN